MTIELHAFDTPNGRKISVALEEMALPYEVRIVDIRRGDQHDPAFLEISPNGKIPAIVDPDGPDGKPVSVFESGAILIYLGEKTGKFWPRSLAARIPVLEWLMFQHGGFGPIPGQVHHFLTVENEGPSLRARALLQGDAAALRRDGPQAGGPGVLRWRVVDRRLRHPGVGVAAPAAQGRPGGFPERAAVVRGHDGPAGGAARVRGEAELTRSTVTPHQGP